MCIQYEFISIFLGSLEQSFMPSRSSVHSFITVWDITVSLFLHYRQPFNVFLNYMFILE